jgi:hypothetical protein
MAARRRGALARMIPSWPVEARSSAERRVFEALRAALPDEYVVLHSVKMLEPGEARRSVVPKEWETDFVIAHPQNGATVLEVKGGRVNLDATSGRWSSTDRDGQVHEIRNPFVQAEDFSRALLRTLRVNSRFPGQWGPIGYAVAFPDGTLATRHLAYGPAEIILSATDFGDPPRLRHRVEAILAYWGPHARDGSGPRGLDVLIDTVAHDFVIQTLKVAINQADEEFVTLSQLQYGLLECIEENSRVAIAGCAGSGKTLLAMEKARRLAASGMKTLLTCFNRPLADHLEKVAGDLPNLLICSFHQLCVHMAKTAGVARPRGQDVESEYYEQILPEVLLRAVEVLKPDFDAIVVDEGQNFHSSWWDPLQLSLRDPDKGILYVFYDDNQALYKRPRGLPSGMFSFRLQENWRNTKRIHEVVSDNYQGGPITAKGPEGIRVERIAAASRDDVRDEVRRLLHRLCHEEGITSGDIVVLSPRSAEHSGLIGEIGSYRLVEQPIRPNEIALRSIFHFQGLEAKVVIVAGVRRRDENFKELMYVACSRARSHLVVISFS